MLSYAAIHKGFDITKVVLYRIKNEAMRRSKRFILLGMEAHQNVEMGGSNEMFESIDDLKKYIKNNNYRSEYLEVFDKEKGKEFSVSEFV